MVSRAFSSAEMGCQIGQSETGRDFDEGSFSRMDCCAATSSPESNSEPQDGSETCAMDSAASSTLSGEPGPGDCSNEASCTPSQRSGRDPPSSLPPVSLCLPIWSEPDHNRRRCS